MELLKIIDEVVDVNARYITKFLWIPYGKTELKDAIEVNEYELNVLKKIVKEGRVNINLKLNNNE